MEDSAYRDSTQFRLWSFSPTQYEKHKAAAYTTAISRNKTSTSQTPTQDESQTLLLAALLELYHLSGSVFRVPTNVVYTALTFLSRFYALHSPLTYAPSSLVPTTLYLATKTENHYISITHFLSALPSHYGADKTTLLAPEFVIASGLRWAFDVRQPFRALEATVLEILSLMEGTYAAPPAPASSLEDGGGNKDGVKPAPIPTTAEAVARFSSFASGISPETVKALHGEARALLKLEVPVSEIPFCFTPGQIALAALSAAGPAGAQLVRAYVAAKGAPDAVNGMVDDCAERIRNSKEKLAGCKGPAWDEEVKRIKRLVSEWGKSVDLVKSDQMAKAGPGVEKVKKVVEGPKMRDSDVFGEGLGSIPRRN